MRTWLLAMALISGMTSAEELTRKNLAEWNSGPGKELGRKQSEKELEELNEMLNAIKKARVTKSIQKTQNARINGRLVIAFPDAKTKSLALIGCRAEIEDAKKRIENPPVAYPAIHFSDLQVGRIGVIAKSVPGWPISEDGVLTIEVVQVIDESSAIVDIPRSSRRDKQTVWLNIPTTGLVDDKVYEFDGNLIEVVGTKQYETVMGALKTVLHLAIRTPRELQE